MWFKARCHNTSKKLQSSAEIETTLANFRIIYEKSRSIYQDTWIIKLKPDEGPETFKTAEG